MVIGIPVYLHYCGGELENINYVMKGTSCCGEDESSAADGCCKDENLILKSTADFTLRAFAQHDFTNACCLLFTTPVHLTLSARLTGNFTVTRIFPPPRLRHNLLMSVSVLRI
jgi:hypothetical protein